MTKKLTFSQDLAHLSANLPVNFNTPCEGVIILKVMRDPGYEGCEIASTIHPRVALDIIAMLGKKIEEGKVKL
jgi:hypothetical protein